MYKDEDFQTELELSYERQRCKHRAVLFETKQKLEEDEKQVLLNIIDDLVCHDGIIEFIISGVASFCFQCFALIRHIERHRQEHYRMILAKFPEPFYTDINLPDTEPFDDCLSFKNLYAKTKMEALSDRNRQLLALSKVVVTYFPNEQGALKKTIQEAKTQGKKCISILEYKDKLSNFHLF